jgi:hypothetical protein
VGKWEVQTLYKPANGAERRITEFVGIIVGMVGEGNACGFFEDASWNLNVILEDWSERGRRKTEREGPK